MFRMNVTENPDKDQQGKEPMKNSLAPGSIAQAREREP